MAEHSERGRQVTDEVELWIVNDGDFYEEAMEHARTGPEALGEYLTRVLRRARRGSAPWHVAQDLAALDYDRIDWGEVAAGLVGEDAG